jgi:hypothetical protein
MNKFFRNKALIAVILAVSIIACSSVQRTTYVTLATTVNLVEAARASYDILYKAGQIPQATDDQVLVLYTKYQNAMNAALLAFKSYKIVADADGLADPTVVNNLIAQVQPLVTDLFLLFQKAGVQSATPVAIQQVGK